MLRKTRMHGLTLFARADVAVQSPNIEAWGEKGEYQGQAIIL
jgi:hypothetical protein